MKVELIEGSGNKRAINSAKNIAAATEYGVEKALYFTGKDLVGEFKRQVLSTNKTGRLYFRYTRTGRRRHIASAPGETPANRTGTYRKLIGFKVSGGNKLTFGNSAEYAGYLEIGTSRMKKRPGLRNSVRASERTIIRNLAGEIEDRI